jgi:hypothetical protein
MARRSKSILFLGAVLAAIGATAWASIGSADGTSVRVFQGIESSLCQFPVAV